MLETERERKILGRRLIGLKIQMEVAQTIYIREEGRYSNTPELKAFLDSISRAGVMYVAQKQQQVLINSSSMFGPIERACTIDDYIGCVEFAGQDLVYTVPPRLYI